MFDAKTHLPELVRNVQKGEIYTLTNRNQEVAILMSISEYHRSSKEAVYEKMKKLFDTPIFETPVEIISMRDEGKR